MHGGNGDVGKKVERPDGEEAEEEEQVRLVPAKV